MDNREHDKRKYCEVMDTIHAPESLRRKVRNMNQESKVKSFCIRKFAYVAAAVVIVFASSNIVTYAMTGSSWVEKIVVRIDGKEQGVDAKHTSYVKDGVEYEEVEINFDEESVSSGLEYIVDESTSNPVSANATVVKRGDSIYLVVENMELDITADLQDGISEGEIKIGEDVYIYKIKGNYDEGEFDYFITKK